MKIEFGDWIIDVSIEEECEAIFSRLTSEQLSIFKVSFDIENSSIKAFEAEFKEYKQGEILVSDENLGLEKQRFSAKVDSSTTSSISTYKTYHISLTECSDRHLSGVMLGEMTFEVDNITQEISQKAIVIQLKSVVTQEQFKKINQLAYGRNIYFPVVRLGISDSPLQMRFGRNVWSEKDGIIKMSLVLVEDVYDKEEDSFHGYSEPELSNAIRQIICLRAINERLLGVLSENNLISNEQKNSIERELSDDEANVERYLFERVRDVEKW